MANQGSGNFSVLLGSGSGAFGSATNFAVGVDPVSVAIGDLNGDGKSDLAVANEHSDNVSVLLNTTAFSPSGAFGPATNFAVGPSPRSIAVGDLNGDGKPDLAVADSSNSGSVWVLLGTGVGAFSSATDFAAGANPYSAVIGDLNGDGIPDLAVANRSNHNVSIFLGVGTGSSAPRPIPRGKLPVLRRDG